MLICTSDFRQGEHAYEKGATVEVAPTIEAWLLSSWPAHFELAPVSSDGGVSDGEVETASFDKPPADKQVKQPARKK